MEINKHRLAHFDREALELLELVKLNPIDPKEPPQNHKPLALDEESYTRYRKLTKDIFETPEVIPYISEKTIRKKTNEWLLKTKQRGKVEQTFTDFLVEAMKNSLNKYKIYFPVINLSLTKRLTLTGVEIIMLDEEFFNSYLQEADEDRKKEVEAFRNDYQGRVYATCAILSEKERAREQTFIRCEIAMFLLRICSNTLDDPQSKLVFELESKSSIQFDELLEERFDGDEGELNISSSAKSLPFTLNDEELKKIEGRGLRKYEDFISTVNFPPSKLQYLLLRALEKFSDALAKDYWERITDLISILDSLLVSDYSVPIVNSVSKYASKLLTTNPEKRKEIVRIIKAMYEVRSRFVHHAEDIEFEQEELKKLQHYVHGILLLFMEKSKQHQTKQTILKEVEDAIEDAILNAYNPNP